MLALLIITASAHIIIRESFSRMRFCPYNYFGLTAATCSNCELSAHVVGHEENGK